MASTWFQPYPNLRNGFDWTEFFIQKRSQVKQLHSKPLCERWFVAALQKDCLQAGLQLFGLRCALPSVNRQASQVSFHPSSRSLLRGLFPVEQGSHMKAFVKKSIVIDLITMLFLTEIHCEKQRRSTAAFLKGRVVIICFFLSTLFDGLESKPITAFLYPAKRSKCLQRCKQKLIQGLLCCDNSAAQADFAIIEHSRLSLCDRALWLVEGELNFCFRKRGE